MTEAKQKARRSLELLHSYVNGGEGTYELKQEYCEILKFFQETLDVGKLVYRFDAKKGKGEYTWI